VYQRNYGLGEYGPEPSLPISTSQGIPPVGTYYYPNTTLGTLPQQLLPPAPPYTAGGAFTPSPQQPLLPPPYSIPPVGTYYYPGSAGMPSPGPSLPSANIAPGTLTYGTQGMTPQPAPVSIIPSPPAPPPQPPQLYRGHVGRGPKGYKRSDERLYEEVCEKLSVNPMVDARGISVDVRDGEVILEGEVEYRQMKRAAEDVAFSVWGVKDVSNRIRIKQTAEDEASHEDEERGVADVEVQAEGEEPPRE
jgi:BON domain